MRTLEAVGQVGRLALAALDAQIDSAERTRRRCLIEAGDQPIARRTAARAKAALRLAEERLAKLQASRRMMMGGTA